MKKNKLINFIKISILIAGTMFNVPAFSSDYYALEKINTPTKKPVNIYGGYANGCLDGAISIPLNGNGFQTMRPSRKRFWGHPNLIKYLTDLSINIKENHPWNGILIGDLSRPVGGPMKSGHKSHQSGLDVDLWLDPMPENILSISERETKSANSYVKPNMEVRDIWNSNNRNFVLMAAMNKNVERIFINAALKKDICEHHPDKENLLRKIRPWFGHDHHIHVRLRCPDGMKFCVGQDPTPLGSGCDNLDWWFSKEALMPIKKDKEKKHKTLNDLPKQCQNMVSYPSIKTK